MEVTQKTLLLVLQVLFFGLKKQTCKNVMDTTFKETFSMILFIN